jgi:hypothetical protein
VEVSVENGALNGEKFEDTESEEVPIDICHNEVNGGFGDGDVGSSLEDCEEFKEGTDSDEEEDDVVVVGVFVSLLKGVIIGEVRVVDVDGGESDTKKGFEYLDTTFPLPPPLPLPQLSLSLCSVRVTTLVVEDVVENKSKGALFTGCEVDTV